MPPNSRYTKFGLCLDAQNADGVGNAVTVQESRHLLLQVASANSANLTLKIQGSLSETVPDFSAAQSLTNHWDYVAVYDLQDAALVAGDTGLVLSGTDDFRNFLVNSDGFQFINCEVSSRVAGDITVRVRPYTNI